MEPILFSDVKAVVSYLFSPSAKFSYVLLLVDWDRRWSCVTDTEVAVTVRTQVKELLVRQGEYFVNAVHALDKEEIINLGILR
jgi:hypothetical protein